MHQILFAVRNVLVTPSQSIICFTKRITIRVAIAITISDPCIFRCQFSPRTRSTNSWAVVRLRTLQVTFTLLQLLTTEVLHLSCATAWRSCCRWATLILHPKRCTRPTGATGWLNGMWKAWLQTWKACRCLCNVYTGSRWCCKLQTDPRFFRAFSAPPAKWNSISFQGSIAFLDSFANKSEWKKCPNPSCERVAPKQVHETGTREWVVSRVIVMFYGPCDSSISCIMMYHEWSWIWMMLQFLFMSSAHCSSLRLWMGTSNIPMLHAQEQTSALVTQQWHAATIIVTAKPGPSGLVCIISFGKKANVRETECLWILRPIELSDHSLLLEAFVGSFRPDGSQDEVLRDKLRLPWWHFVVALWHAWTLAWMDRHHMTYVGVLSKSLKLERRRVMISENQVSVLASA